MADFFNFVIYALGKTVTFMFSLHLGLGFTVGDLEVAFLVIALVASALVIQARKIDRYDDG